MSKAHSMWKKGPEPRPLLPRHDPTCPQSTAHCIASSKYSSPMQEAFNECLPSVWQALPSPTRCLMLSLSHCESLKARARGRREETSSLCSVVPHNVCTSEGSLQVHSWSAALQIQKFDFIHSFKGDETLGGLTHAQDTD